MFVPGCLLFVRCSITAISVLPYVKITNINNLFPGREEAGDKRVVGPPHNF